MKKPNCVGINIVSGADGCVIGSKVVLSWRREKEKKRMIEKRVSVSFNIFLFSPVVVVAELANKKQMERSGGCRTVANVFG